MPTSVHIPKPLLETVDKRARALHISRNRFIIKALERQLAQKTDWSPEFFDRLRQSDDKVRVAADELLDTIRNARRSKGPVRL